MYPWFNVCGHLHNNVNALKTLTPQHFNVSCEVLNYRPVNLNEIMTTVKTRYRSLEDKEF
jgi:calcineurin-like phosphoesterase family protein